jgi:hypothetical protein
MSATFFVTFNGHHLKFREHSPARKVYQIVKDKAAATPFVCEADAWLAADRYNLRPVKLVEVVQ